MADNTNKSLSDGNANIHFDAGSTPIYVAIVQEILLRKSGNMEVNKLTNDRIGFDFKRHGPVDVEGLLDLGIDIDDSFDRGDFIQARLPADIESLEKAEVEGKLCLLPPDWYQNPKASLDDLGASGDPRIGATLAIINEAALSNRLLQALRRHSSHATQQQLAISGIDTDNRSPRIPMICHGTSVGGLGSGVLIWLIPKVKELASRHGIAVKIIIDLMFRGNLPVDDAHKADTNQANFLKFHQACATGQCVDPLTGKLRKQVVDLFFLQSDQNRNGGLPTIHHLIAHEAQCQMVLWNSILSARIRERLTDIENWKSDEYGDPLIGFSISCSRIRRDREKVLAYLCNKAASMLAGHLNRKQGQKQSGEEGLALAKMHAVVESDEDDVLTARIMSPSEFKGQSSLKLLRSNFADRIEATSGLKGANAREEAINAIDSNDLSNVYEAAMVKEAEEILDKTRTALSSYIDQKLRGLAALVNEDSARSFDASGFLAVYRDCLEVSRQNIMRKISQIMQFEQPHQDVTNHAMEELERIRNFSRMWRWLYFLRIRRIADSLESSGLVYLESELQIRACKVAIEKLLDKLIDFVDTKLAELGMLSQNLQLVFASCKQQAESWSAKPATIDVPLGIDLVTKDYLNDLFNQFVAESTDEQNFIHNLTIRFLSKYHSAGSLLAKSPDEIQQILKSICEAVFEPWIRPTNVVSEFKRLYPSIRAQRRLFRQLILESEGRVRTVGESSREIPWLKFVTTPRAEDAEWARELIERADQKSGKWHVVVDGDFDTITVVQLRGAISLTQLIARSNLPDDAKGWKERARTAVDCITAIMVPPNPDDRQLRRVFAKAIVIEQLIQDPTKGFILQFLDEDPVLLGKEPEAAMQALRKWWPHCVRIESTFWHLVVVDDGDVAQRIERLKSSQNDNDPRFSLIDDTAIVELQEQLALLTPWAKRLRTAMQNG